MGKLRHGWRNVVPSWITHALVLVLKPRGVDFENKQFIYSSVVPRLSPKPSRMISWDDVMAGVLPCCVGEVGGFGDTGHPGCPHAGGGGLGGLALPKNTAPRASQPFCSPMSCVGRSMSSWNEPALPPLELAARPRCLTNHPGLIRKITGWGGE